MEARSPSGSAPVADLSDTQIRADLRSVLTESGIDPNKTSFICARGVVRLLGEILELHTQDPVQPTKIDELEQSIRNTKGVKRVHFNLTNWERVGSGKWVPTGAEARKEQEKVSRPERLLPEDDDTPGFAGDASDPRPI